MRDDIAAFLEHEKGNRATQTYKCRKTGCNRYDEWLSQMDMAPQDVGSRDFRVFIAWLRNERGVSDGTAYQYLTQVWRLHQFLAEEDDAVVVPDKKDIVDKTGLNLEESEQDKNIPKDRRALTPDEMSMMIDHAPAPEFKSGLVMKILGATGIRPQDLRDLEVGDVDDDYRWLEVHSTKTHSRRKIPIPDSLRSYLRLWLENGYRAACAYADRTDYLIPGEYSKQLGRRTVNTTVEDAAESAGLQEVVYEDANGNPRYRITPYSFRYGYGNHMKNEVDPERLQTLMGHKSVTTTLEFYNAASEDELEAAGAVAPDP